MAMTQTNLERELRLVKEAQDSYKSRLDALIPMLLDSALSMMRQKKVAIQLTSEFDYDGAYLNPNVKRPSARYMAFPEGIVRVETIYGENSLSKTKEVPVSKEEYLRWVSEALERSQDAYNRLRSYSSTKPFESHFPADDLI